MTTLLFQLFSGLCRSCLQTPNLALQHNRIKKRKREDERQSKYTIKNKRNQYPRLTCLGSPGSQSGRLQLPVVLVMIARNRCVRGWTREWVCHTGLQCELRSRTGPQSLVTSHNVTRARRPIPWIGSGHEYTINEKLSENKFGHNLSRFY